MYLIAKNNMKNSHIYAIQFLLAFCILFAQSGFSVENLLDQAALIQILRYGEYLLLLQGSEDAVVLAHCRWRRGTRGAAAGGRGARRRAARGAALLAAAAAALLYAREPLLQPDFVLFIIASLVVKYLQITGAATAISYGTGMACSYYEGYLVTVLPHQGSDDARGFQAKISTFESREGVVFPVRRLFIVITRSLYCPPDLALLNHPHRAGTTLEPCQSLDDVSRSVAGVIGRVYRNTVYKIVRTAPAPGAAPPRPLYLAAECATPLHTLHKVKTRSQLYDELVNADYEEIREDFCAMLREIIARAPACRRAVELVYYDDTDEEQNLADILLQRIAEIEPNYDTLTRD